MTERKLQTQTDLIPEFVFDGEKDEIYKELFHGLRDNKDPITVRTFLVDVGHLMGVDVEWEEIPKEKWGDTEYFVNEVTKNTFWEALNPEYLDALGLKSIEKESLASLKLVVANGRHKAEPLWGRLTEYVDELYPGRVGKFNPVGHYNDGQPRVAGPRRLFRNLDTLVVLGSTQTEKGGSLEVVSHVSRLIRNPDFSLKIDNLAVVVPFFGGSRGHRKGQRDGLVYEILEMVSNPKILALPILEAKIKLWWDVVRDEFKDINPMAVLRALFGKDLPKLKVVTVDIHNNELPGRKFKQMGIEFIDADPTPETAKEMWRIVEEQGLKEENLLIMASDEGAIPRTDRFSEEAFWISGKEEIYVGNMIKKRLYAGKVKEVKMGKIEKWTKEDGKIVKTEMSEDEVKELFSEGLVLVKSDDMMDTGNTNTADEKFLKERMKVIYSITVATHPVFSKGTKILDSIGSDAYVFTNTLIHNGLSGRDNVSIVDAAPAITRALGF